MDQPEYSQLACLLKWWQNTQKKEPAARDTDTTMKNQWSDQQLLMLCTLSSRLLSGRGPTTHPQVAERDTKCRGIYVIKQIAVACLPSLNGAFTESLASAAAAMSATASLNTVLLRMIFQLLHIEKIHKSLNSLLCIHASPFPAFGCPYPVIVKWNFQSLNACEYSLSNGKIN